MKLIADSGSTKTDWVLIKGPNDNYCFQTIGLNPLFVDEEKIQSVLSTKPELIEASNQVKEIYFYGASCSDEVRNQVLVRAFKAIFKNAIAKVHHDVYGSVLATCGDDKGIACIIGTGSNACYYDGQNMYDGLPALGFVLGDEGSGAYLGKNFLKDYLYQEVPIELKESFEEELSLSKDVIFERVYKADRPNAFLASMSLFLAKHKYMPYVEKLIKKGFDTFINRHVCQFEVHKDIPIHFIGSVAFHYRSILEEVMKEKGLKLGKILQKPINALLRYHLR